MFKVLEPVQSLTSSAGGSFGLPEHHYLHLVSLSLHLKFKCLGNVNSNFIFLCTNLLFQCFLVAVFILQMLLVRLEHVLDVGILDLQVL